MSPDQFGHGGIEHPLRHHHLDRVAITALANELVETGEDERIRLTTRGRLLSNEVFARLV